MPTCNKGQTSTKYSKGYPVTCECTADHTYECSDGSKWYDAGSSVNTADVIRQQDKVRELQGLPPWVPWAAGGVAVGALTWLLLRR